MNPRIKELETELAQLKQAEIINNLGRYNRGSAIRSAGDNGVILEVHFCGSMKELQVIEEYLSKKQ